MHIMCILISNIALTGFSVPPEKRAGVLLRNITSATYL